MHNTRIIFFILIYIQLSKAEQTFVFPLRKWLEISGTLIGIELDPTTASLYRLPTRYLQLSSKNHGKLFLFIIQRISILVAFVFPFLFLSTNSKEDPKITYLIMSFGWGPFRIFEKTKIQRKMWNELFRCWIEESRYLASLQAKDISFHSKPLFYMILLLTQHLAGICIFL